MNRLNKSLNFTSFLLSLVNNQELEIQQESNFNELFYNFSKYFNVITNTLITLFGLFGNTMSICIFRSENYRKNSVQASLILLSFADLFVLLLQYLDFTFRQWINLFGFYSSSFNFVDKSVFFCKLIPYLKNVFKTISIYTLILITLERIVILYFPFKRSKWLKHSKRSNFYLFWSALVFNSYVLLFNTLEQHSVNRQLYCTIRKNFLAIYFYVDIIFVGFTIMIPSIIILILSIFLVRKVSSNYPSWTDFYKASSKSNNSRKKSKYHATSVFSSESTNFFKVSNGFKMRKMLRLPSTSRSLKPNNIINIESVAKKADEQENVDIKQINTYKSSIDRISQIKTKHSIKTTCLLILLSKWFVILHLPYFISWVIYHVQLRTLKHESTKNVSLFLGNVIKHGFSNLSSLSLFELNKTNMNTQSYQIAQKDYMPTSIGDRDLKLIRSFLNVFEALMLFNYSINFILYIFNGSKFRNEFIFFFKQTRCSFKCFNCKFYR
jgi:hypothetical protein